MRVLTTLGNADDGGKRRSCPQNTSSRSTNRSVPVPSLLVVRFPTFGRALCHELQLLHALWANRSCHNGSGSLLPSQVAAKSCAHTQHTCQQPNPKPCSWCCGTNGGNIYQCCPAQAQGTAGPLRRGATTAVGLPLPRYLPHSGTTTVPLFLSHHHSTEARYRVSDGHERRSANVLAGLSRHARRPRPRFGSRHAV